MSARMSPETEQLIRDAMLAGESQTSIRKRLKVGSNALTRIARDLDREGIITGAPFAPVHTGTATVRLNPAVPLIAQIEREAVTHERFDRVISLQLHHIEVQIPWNQTPREHRETTGALVMLVDRWLRMQAGKLEGLTGIDSSNGEATDDADVAESLRGRITSIFAARGAGDVPVEPIRLGGAGS